MTIHPCFIGCDIAKSHLDLFEETSGTSLRIANTSEAIATWLSSLDCQASFVAFEATGPYDHTLRQTLEQAGCRFARINPARARDFARATGRLAKTDAIDAEMLAAMARMLALMPDAASDPARNALAQLHKRRDQLVEMRAAERVRDSEGQDPTGSLARHLAWLDAEIATLEHLVSEALRADETLARTQALLRSAPGIGPVTAVTLIALMPELGHVSPKAIAALAGLAPFNNDSGRRRGQRMIRGGRRRVRKALYMAALAAIRTSARFKTFYDAVRARSAAAKVAIIAVARKLLVTLNAMLKTDTAFQP
ncbi:transposase [Bosea sp. 685]|uniref:transposase n=1 Tax=Bosea sp. 685 TaxID=3080057 RepID=UPI0028937246|nr:transposase [Bosea sp. 685]WNJ88550.1 transposase [Bosea sp. 685]WNJ88755.1 transposase [Bosea sp. 685]WNJ90834.1 transposase [Bosea sp. 685]